MNAIAKTAFKDDPHKTDWRLVHDEVLAANKLRNKIAHSSMLTSHDGRMYVLPFFSLSRIDEDKLFSADIDTITNRIDEIRRCVQWIEFRHRNSETQRQEWREQEPDLIRRLRARDVQSREAQRHRALAWRQYLDRNPDLKLP
ncbi:MAG: hypothetical protein AB7V39_29490 [Nitrospiraceae bacterium]